VLVIACKPGATRIYMLPPLAAGLLLIGTIAIVTSALFARRHEADLEAEARGDRVCAASAETSLSGNFELPH
jgi:hypothetical protein